MAAVAGKLMGKTRWPGTIKTVEGTLMAIMTQLLGVLVIILIGRNPTGRGGREGVVGGCCLGLEASRRWA